MCSCIIFANILYYHISANALKHGNVIFQHQFEPKTIFLNLKLETILTEGSHILNTALGWWYIYIFFLRLTFSFPEAIYHALLPTTTRFMTSLFGYEFGHEIRPIAKKFKIKYLTQSWSNKCLFKWLRTDTLKSTCKKWQMITKVHQAYYMYELSASLIVPFNYP